ncbi:MAG: hypoxanthine/guanine phosphoribosyltransferase [Candidatus Thalassarchaeaceae archaeon]|jgi:adenine phosphoribosyltransferase|nr:hypoxanthine/guanine phosphoribosyltransferase [Candidatus Thalassarchaeaceae archaeon]
MEDNVKRLRQSVIDAPVVMKGEYAYFVHPLTDGVPRQSSDILRAAHDLISEDVNWNTVDIILGIEAMGIPLAAALSFSSGKPLIIARKRSYGLPGEVEIGQSTGYSKGEIYLNDIQSGERVLVVDDVVSTGGTLEPILSTLEDIGAIIAGVQIVFEKGDGMERLRKKYGWALSSLVQLRMAGDKIVLLE